MAFSALTTFLAGYMERVLDQDTVNYLFDILQEEGIGRSRNGHRAADSALTEGCSDFVPTPQMRRGIEDGGLASRFPLQEVCRPDNQRQKAGAGGHYAQGGAHHVVSEVQKSRGENQITCRHDAEPKADAKDPATVGEAEFSRCNQQEEQKTENEDAFAAHRLGDKAQQKPVTFTTRCKHGCHGCYERNASHPAEGYGAQPLQAGKRVHGELKQFLNDQEDEESAGD